MPSQAVIYEQPLNERIRICLRIEALIDRLDYFQALDSDHASYQALLTVLEITALVERGDVKQEIIKELDRQHKVLTALVSHQSVDKSRLEMTLNHLKQALNRMHGMDGRLGEHLKSIDFLLSVKQRSVIPGGSCDFDLPQLRYWLNRTLELRQRDLDRWSAPYRELNQTLALTTAELLRLLDLETIMGGSTGPRPAQPDAAHPDRQRGTVSGDQRRQASLQYPFHALCRECGPTAPAGA